MDPLLSSAAFLKSLNLKLARARLHMEELKESLDGFRDEGHYRVTSKTESEGGGRWLTTWDVRRTKAFPDDWAVLLGEVLYQLHSSLDHAAWQMAALEAAPEEPDRVLFPIFKNKKKFWKTDKEGAPRQSSGGWALDRFPEPARQLVLDVQPYQCGDRSPHHPLWLLHVLSNEDKHKALHIASSAATKKRFDELRLDDLVIEGFEVGRKPFDAEAQDFAWLRVAGTGSKPKIAAKVSFLFEEVFSEGSPDEIGGELVFETVKGVFNYVVTEVFAKRIDPFMRAQ